MNSFGIDDILQHRNTSRTSEDSISRETGGCSPVVSQHSTDSDGNDDDDHDVRRLS